MKALPLILIAGWGHTGDALLPLQAALDGHPAQITSTGALRQTRSGDGEPPAPGLSRYALALHDLLLPHGGRAVVIGWSMGGIVALETARAFPGLMQRLVVISGTARFCAGGDEPPGVSASVLRAMALGLRRTPDKVLAAYYAQVHAPQAVPAGEGVARAPGSALPDRGELPPGLDYLQRMDVRRGLEHLMVPTLVLHGREDRIVPWQAGEGLSRALGAGRWRCYANYGHALPVQAPLLLAAEIRTFLGDAA